MSCTERDLFDGDSLQDNQVLSVIALMSSFSWDVFVMCVKTNFIAFIPPPLKNNEGAAF